MAKVCFIGLGVMGYPMAGHLSKAGHQVFVYNRTIEKAEKWAKKFKGQVCETPKDAANKSEYIFVCVGNDDGLDNFFAKLVSKFLLKITPPLTIGGEPENFWVTKSNEYKNILLNLYCRKPLEKC